MASPMDALRQKESQASEPQDQQAAPQQAAPDDQNADNGASSVSDEATAQTVNLRKSYSKLQEALARLVDGSGMKRTITVPYGHSEMSDHVQAVGQALTEAGGSLSNHLIASYHHSGKGGWGTDQGETVAYNSDKLRQTIIPVKSEVAKAAVDAAKSFISKIAFLLGKDDPTVQVAQSQLKLLGARDMAGMNLADALVALINIGHKPLQAVSKAHSNAQHNGEFHAQLTGHRES